MWIFTKTGFLSIKEHWDDSDCLLVRGRIKGDIEHYFPKATVEHTPDNDYLYRAKIPKIEFATVMVNEIMKIDYTSFKSEIEDRRRIPWHLRIGAIMEDMQERIEDED